jgi:large subunit ribosomal protein L21
MIKYAVVQIGGKQYKAEPGKELFVDFLGEDTKTLKCEQVLLRSGDKLEIGTPFLKDSLNFEVIGQKKSSKIRVATYHAKANYRRVKGSKQVKSIIKLQA